MSRYFQGSKAVVGAIAAGIFLVAFIIFKFLVGYTFFPALFLSLLVTVLTTIVIFLGFGADKLESSVAAARDATSKIGKEKSDTAAAAPVAAPVSDTQPIADPEPAAEADPIPEAEPTPEPEPAAEPEPAPEPQSAPESSAEIGGKSKPTTLDGPESGQADDLKKIKGVGPKMEDMLNGMGFYHFHQIASWGPGEVAWVDDNLDGFKGRVSRDDWVEQAKLLASGGDTEFSQKVDKGDVY